VSDFIPVLRGTFLYLSKQPDLRRWMETSPYAQRLTRRFVAGLHLEDAIAAARELAAQRMLVSLDHLGENVATEAEARAARDAHLNSLRRIAEERLGGTVSAKLTSLGLDISRELCMENAAGLVRAARDTGTRVEFDMEDSSYVDRTLSVIHELRDSYGDHVRAVIQAYLYRSEADVAELCRRGIPVRLCKGAYREPPSVAWPAKADVDRNYVRLMQMLFDKGTYPAIATHDDAMIGQALEWVRRHGVRADAFEFQMLYGVRRKLQQDVVDRGFRLRLYVPYGAAWYPYFMRRLAERPANVLFLAKSFVRD
jgi:proline dehydrogenase